MFRSLVSGALFAAALLWGATPGEALAQSAPVLGRTTAAEQVYDVPMPADFAEIVTASGPKYARFKKFLKTTKEESGGQSYDILTARIAWDKDKIDTGAFAMAGDHGASGDDWVQVDAGSAEWQALVPQLKAMIVTRNGDWSYSELKIYVPQAGGPATLSIPIPELVLITKRMEALEPATAAGIYYPAVKRPADLDALRAEMLAFGNLARRDADYRKKYKTKTAFDLSGDTVTTSVGREKIYKKNPAPPYFSDVSLNDKLNEAAQFQAEYMASIGRMTHDGPSTYRDPKSGAVVNMHDVDKRSVFFGGPQNVVEAAGEGPPGVYPHGWMVTDTHFRPWFEIDGSYPMIGYGAALGANGKWYFAAVPVRYADGVVPADVAAAAPPPPPPAAPASEPPAAAGMAGTALDAVRGPFEFQRGLKYPSASGGHYVIFQNDGNLAIYTRDDQFVWGLSTDITTFPQNAKAVFQADGNLATYDANGGFIWSALNKALPTGGFLTLTAEGKLQITDAFGTYWSSP